MVPAQKRPARSQRPSLKRFSGRCASGLATGASAPLAASRKWIPLFVAARSPPFSRNAMLPTTSGSTCIITAPLAGSRRFTAGQRLSTHHSIFSRSSHSGHSPSRSAPGAATST